MNTHVVSATQRFLELHVLDPGFLFLGPLCVAQIHQLLNGSDVLVVVIRRVIAKNIHVKTRALLDHGQADAAGADDRDRLVRDFVAEEWQEWMPRRPLLFPYEALALPHLARQHAHHKKGELSRRFGEHVSGVRKWNFVFVRVGAVDVVKTDRDLRYYLE